tara:strand:+ start:225 stop:656 length:432 start_codon:yes stop_codon:yes gene_type:complete
MKNLLYLFLAVILFSCSSDSDDDNNSNIENLGTYRGSIDVYINGSYHATLNNHSMTFVSDDNTNEVLIQGNLIMTTYCNFNSNGFTIPETIAATTQMFDVIEYGSGDLNGTTLQIELHQDQISNTTNESIGTGTWLGTLTKIQ